MKVFINTAGIGDSKRTRLGVYIAFNQVIRLSWSGTLGDHGATILNLRENLGIQTDFTQ